MTILLSRLESLAHQPQKINSLNTCYMVYGGYFNCLVFFLQNSIVEEILGVTVSYADTINLIGKVRKFGEV